MDTMDMKATPSGQEKEREREKKEDEENDKHKQQQQQQQQQQPLQNKSKDVPAPGPGPGPAPAPAPADESSTLLDGEEKELSGHSDQNAGGGGEKDGSENATIPLVGGLGCDYVSRVLSTFAPQEAVREIQEKTQVHDARYNPVFGLLQQMGLERAEVSKILLSSIIQALLRNIQTLTQEENMLDLLEASFIYIRIPELRSIPIAVLERLKSVPNNFLKQLSADRAVFNDLPQSVQRQVWELDKSLLQQHVSPYIHCYVLERATTLSCLNMNEENPNKQFLGMSVPSVYRQTYRNGSASLKKVTSIIDKSNKIYKYIVNLCLTLYRESEKPFMSKDEQAYCSFRSQLLMALHDSVNELRTVDPCHRLAWTLDAAIKERSCEQKRLHELMQIFNPYDRKNRKKMRFSRSIEDGGGSTSQPDESTVLGEMGMILRDPPVYFFLARQALKRLEHVVEAQTMPRDDSALTFLSRLLQIASNCRFMLREKSFKFLKVDEGLMRDFYPRLGASLVDRKLLKAGKQLDVKALDQYALGEWLVSHHVNHNVAQVVYQVFVIDCLAKSNFEVAQQALMTIASVLPKITSKAMVEWSPFMYSLAERLQSLVQSKAIDTKGDVWELAVDRILIKAINSEVEVHKHVLLLIQVASSQLSTDDVIRYLETMLDLSEKSRKRFKKKQIKLLQNEEENGYNVGSPPGQTFIGPDRNLLAKRRSNQDVNDGVYESYRQLVNKSKTEPFHVLTEENAPKLFEYLKPTVES